MKKLFLVFLIGLITGCAGVLAPVPSYEEYNKTLSLWKGKQLTEVVAVYGVPNGQVVLGEVTYHKFSRYQKIGYEIADCEVTFETNKQNIVTMASLTKPSGKIYQNIDPCYLLVKPPTQ